MQKEAQACSVCPVLWGRRGWVGGKTSQPGGASVLKLGKGSQRDIHLPLPSFTVANGPNGPRIRARNATAILTILDPTPNQYREENNTKVNSIPTQIIQKPYSIPILLDLGGRGKCILVASYSLTKLVELR